MAKKDLYFGYAEAVFSSDLKPNSKLIALAIADYYNWSKHTPAYPSFPTLAKRTGLSKNTVIAHVKALNETGWLMFKGYKIINNIKVNQWKPTIPPVQNIDLPYQNSDSPYQNNELTIPNFTPDFGIKQITNIEVYKQRINKEEHSKSNFGKALSALSKMKTKAYK